MVGQIHMQVIIGGKRNWAHAKSSRSRHYYFRRCKKKRNIILLTNIESLPDDLLLVKLRAQDIYKLVHPNWYRMVHTRAFIHAHLQNSTQGLMFERLFWRLDKAAESRYLSLLTGSI